LKKSRGIAINFTKLKDKVIEEYSLCREMFRKRAAGFMSPTGVVASSASIRDPMGLANARSAIPQYSIQFWAIVPYEKASRSMVA
jgi:hypothetical protein